MGRFRYKSALLILCAVILCAVAAVAQEPIFYGSTKLVRLIVSVKDASGQAIGTLDKSDFSVTDSGVAQTITFFEHHTEVPLSVSLLIDVSGSTGKDLGYEVDSLKKFIRALLKEGNPDDAIALYSFDSDVTELAVIPKLPSSLLVVTTVTPLARWPTTCRNVVESTSGSIEAESEAMLLRRLSCREHYPRLRRCSCWLSI